ncbi:hypothetical protein D9757_010774 [Collybiopsis confluens]|uniref:Uncharacterized protein n=1 Tax=Collybiopsis confluens TaxID=2823264 RepID=A0A8H5H8G3_9AGAR|nr:hypothetical protein D9757_010774 [Collybiopsis confluens]
MPCFAGVIRFADDDFAVGQRAQCSSRHMAITRPIFAVLDEQKTNLQNVITRLRDDIRKLESSTEKSGSLERYRNDKSSLESNAEAHASENATLRERVAVLQDQTFEVPSLKDEITAQQGLMSKQVSDIAVLHSEIAKLEGDSAELREEQKTLKLEAAGLKDDIMAQQGVVSRQTSEIAVLQTVRGGEG